MRSANKSIFMKYHCCYFPNVRSKNVYFGENTLAFMSRNLFGSVCSVLYVESCKRNRMLLDKMALRCVSSVHSAGLKTLTNVTSLLCRTIFNVKSLKQVIDLLDLFVNGSHNIKI